MESTKEYNDDMFIVINKKRFAEMGDEGQETYRLFSYALDSFVQDYEQTTGKSLNQKYLVCNQDEPYAERVKAIILGTEESRDASIAAQTRAECAERAVKFQEKYLCGRNMDTCPQCPDCNDLRLAITQGQDDPRGALRCLKCGSPVFVEKWRHGDDSASYRYKCEKGHAWDEWFDSPEEALAAREATK